MGLDTSPPEVTRVTTDPTSTSACPCSPTAQNPANQLTASSEVQSFGRNESGSDRPGGDGSGGDGGGGGVSPGRPCHSSGDGGGELGAAGGAGGLLAACAQSGPGACSLMPPGACSLQPSGAGSCSLVPSDDQRGPARSCGIEAAAPGTSGAASDNQWLQTSGVGSEDEHQRGPVCNIIITLGLCKLMADQSPPAPGNPPPTLPPTGPGSPLTGFFVYNNKRLLSPFHRTPTQDRRACPPCALPSQLAFPLHVRSPSPHAPALASPFDLPLHPSIGPRPNPHLASPHLVDATSASLITSKRTPGLERPSQTRAGGASRVRDASASRKPTRSPGPSNPRIFGVLTVVAVCTIVVLTSRVRPDFPAFVDPR